MISLLAAPKSLAWLALLLACAALFSLGELSDPDIWWNTAAGAYLLEHGSSPPLELYGVHGCLDALPLEVPLAQVVIGGFFKALGLPGLLLLRFLGVACMALIVALSLARRLPLPQATLWACLVIVALSPRFSVRGELFTMVLFPLVVHLTLLVLEDEVSRRRLGLRLAGLSLLGAAWTWSHGAFPLGLFALLALGAGVLVERARGAAEPGATQRAALALLAFGLGVTTQPDAWTIFGDGAVERQIARELDFREWMPTWQALVARGFSATTLALLLFPLTWLLSLLAYKRPGFFPRFLMAAPVFVIAADVIRGAALPVLVAAAWLPLLPLPATRTARRALLAFLLSVVLAAGYERLVADPPLVGLRDPLRLTPPRLTPVHAAKALREQGVSGRLLAPLHLSNWFVLFDQRSIEVLWSGRRTYSVPCMRALMEALYRPEVGLAPAQARFGFDLALVELETNDALFRQLVEGGWRLLHFDLRYAVLAAPHRTDVRLGEIAAAPQLLEQEVPRSGARGAYLAMRGCERLAYLGQLDEAVELCLLAVRELPEEPAVRITAARVLGFAGRPQEAAAVLGPVRTHDDAAALLQELGAEP